MPEREDTAPGVPHRFGGGWHPVWVVARAAPFVLFAAAGIWRAGQAPAGRRPPRFDWTVTGEAVGRALTKFPHMKWTVVLFVLAVLAVGAARPLLASALALAAASGWELAETTVVGHHAALIDLLPDLVGVALALLVLVTARGLLARSVSRTDRAGSRRRAAGR